MPLRCMQKYYRMYQYNQMKIVSNTYRNATGPRLVVPPLRWVERKGRGIRAARVPRLAALGLGIWGALWIVSTASAGVGLLTRVSACVSLSLVDEYVRHLPHRGNIRYLVKTVAPGDCPCNLPGFPSAIRNIIHQRLLFRSYASTERSYAEMVITHAMIAYVLMSRMSWAHSRILGRWTWSTA